MKKIILLGLENQKLEFLKKWELYGNYLCDEKVTVVSYNHHSKFPLTQLEGADAVILIGGKPINDEITETIKNIEKKIPIEFYTEDENPRDFLIEIITDLQKQTKENLIPPAEKQNKKNDLFSSRFLTFSHSENREKIIPQNFVSTVRYT